MCNVYEENCMRGGGGGGGEEEVLRYNYGREKGMNRTRVD